MISYTLEKIASITGGRTAGHSGNAVSRLLTDSRTSTVSDNMLFFALPGPLHDGHRFIPELHRRGVRSFVVSEMRNEYRTLFGAGFVVVASTLQALQDLARHHREQIMCPVIAITGSNGKTIVKEWLYHCLGGEYTITRSPKSYNSQVGVPLSLWLLDEHTRLAIIEAGISRAGEMENLHRMIRPDTGIFTNIGEAHQENFTSLEQKVQEKLSLFQGCRSLIYCRDHGIISDCIAGNAGLAGVRKFTWSLSGDADIIVSGISRNKGNTSFTAVYGNRSLDLTIPFTDPASLENALHCLSLMLLYETGEETITSRLADLPQVAMRLEQKSAIHGCTLINDSYNSDINSLSIALDLLNRQAQHPRKTLILSDILQSGRKQEELYTTVAAMLKEKGISRMIGIGRALRECASLFDIPAEFYETTDEFTGNFNPGEYNNEAILLKGSRRFEFERIAALLEQKKHTTRVEVNLNALVHNLNHFRSLLNPGTRTLVMVKALSYGSGRHEIAGVLQFQRVDYLGVAFADEGIGLRQSGITLPVVVMNPEPESFDAMIRHRLEPEIYSFRILDLFCRAAARNQEVGYPVHIKIDTGMHRLGFPESEVPRLCLELKRLDLRVVSVFSHLAGSEDAAHDDFSRTQIASFERSSARVTGTLGHPVIRHILNSSGIERFPEAQYDMVRLGIGLYGISATGSDKLKNVSTLKSTILQLKPLYPGDTVGYGRAGKIERPSVIAVVPIGYADGVDRRLGNGRGSFLVNGVPAPVIGNVCMDMTMIDVTGMNAGEGDEVVIYGDRYPVTRMAEALDTIPYEILTGISERVRRVYLYE